MPEAEVCDATVLITTKDRCDELRHALRSVASQSMPVEILVIDDGSTDGTFAMLRQEFPGARVIRHDESRGLIVRRNEGVREARGKIVFSIDDDAAFSTPHVVRQTLAEFTDDAIGAVAMPYVDVNRDPGVKQRAPADGVVYATDRFIGTAHALRRDVFTDVGGYREALVHQGEEGDYCLRMLEAGFFVRLGRADPIHHFESPRRDFRRMDYFGARNGVLFVWQNVPMPDLMWHLPAVMIRLALLTLQPGRLATRLSGMVAGVRLFASQPRLPVSRDAYRLARSLAANPRTLSAEQLRAAQSRVTTPAAKSAINFRNLDALRGLLAVYVAIGHCRWLLWGGHAAWLGSAYQPWEVVPAYASAAFRFGREAVMVFFVLSGFFIHYQAARRSIDSAPHAASAFYRRRWHRLAPPYFFALVVTMVFDAVGRSWWPTLYLARSGDALLDGTFARGGYSAAAVLPALVVLPASVGRDFGSNGPLWSLAFEAVYYAIYPAWLWLRRRSSLAAFGGVPATCLALAFIPVTAFPVTVLAHYPIWLAGAFLAERMAGAGVSSRTAMMGAALFGGGVVLRVLVPTVPLALIGALLFGAGALMFFAAVQWRNRLVTFAEFLGVRSYTIYIVHFPFLALISAYVIHTQGGRPLHGWLAVSGAIACVALGCACFELCERHFLHSRYRDESAAP